MVDNLFLTLVWATYPLRKPYAHTDKNNIEKDLLPTCIVQLLNYVLLAYPDLVYSILIYKWIGMHYDKVEIIVPLNV